jgi:ABC-type dipeptide/oligopeptide/nickel transport system permease subunit
MASQVAIPQLHYHPEERARRRVDRFGLPLRLVFGTALIGLVVLASSLAPQIAPYDPSALNPSERLLAPSAEHFFGTDMFGRDLFSRIIYGAQPTLLVAVGAMLLGLLPGVTLGLLAGQKRSLFDQILTQIVDAWLALPGVLIALVMVAMLGRSLAVLLLALGISAIPTFFRIVRAETMRIYSEEYVEAAVSLGADSRGILLRHVLPNIKSSIIVLCAITVGRMLLATSALSFIGLGAPPPSPEWGSLLAEGRSYMYEHWWLMWFPGAAIALTTFGFYLLGNCLRDRR